MLGYILIAKIVLATVSLVLHPESSTDAAASTRPRVVILGSGWGGYRLAKVIVPPLSLLYALTVTIVYPLSDQ